jgi:maleate isomerase
MTRDVVGTRAKFAYIIPQTNTVVDHDYAQLALPGITFHCGRAEFTVPEFDSDDLFDALVKSIHEGSIGAIRRVMTTRPDYMIMGMSAETFWNGAEGNQEFEKFIRDQCGLGVTTGATATKEALKLFGAKRIAAVSPYQPIGIEHVKRFYTDHGFEVVDAHGFACETPAAMAQLTLDDLRPVVNRFLEQRVDAIVQVGTNLSMVEYAAAIEQHVDIPVIAINAACVWHAYRQMGINDKLYGHGRLFELF